MITSPAPWHDDVRQGWWIDGAFWGDAELAGRKALHLCPQPVPKLEPVRPKPKGMTWGEVRRALRGVGVELP